MKSPKVPWRRSLAFSALFLLALPSAGTDEIFVDATEQSGLDFVHFNGMSGRLYYPEVVGAGGALFDYDGDGDLDLLVIQGHMLGSDRTLEDAIFSWPVGQPLRDRLYRNDLEISSDGGRSLRFVDVTEESGLRSTGYGMGAAAGDVDDDGDVDLYILNMGENQLWLNQGDGTFVDATASSGTGDPLWSVSASFLDYDVDGDLDLFVVNYLNFTYISHKVCLTERGEEDYCLPSAYRPVPDRLYRNDGAGRFTDVSRDAGIWSVPAANGLGSITGDFDGDDRLDLYVANDLMPNHLWLNQGDGSFLEDGLASGGALNRDGRAEASMGLAAGDLDGDGDLDLFMTHFSRETNTLFLNQGGGMFQDVTGSFELAGPSWDYTSFGTGFLDYDNDGWLDLVVVNGAVTFGPGTDRTAQVFPLDQPNQLFRNLEGRGFEEVSQQAGAALARSEVSRGSLLGDVDQDGDTDLVITNNSAPARLLLNQIGSSQPWVGFRVALGRRDGLGAKVRIEPAAGAKSLVRRVQSDGGYASANDPRVLIGLGGWIGADTDVIERVLVTWPGGSTEQWSALALRRYHTLERGQGKLLGAPHTRSSAGGLR